MAAATGTPNLFEPQFFKHWHEAHKAIAGRLRIDRIGFQNVRTPKTGVLDCCAYEFLAVAHATKLSFEKHAYQ